MVRKCKTNFASSRSKPDIDSFSTSGDIWARRWLRWHDLVSPCEKVYEKIFFFPNDSKWSNSQKKTCFQKFENFLPLWPDPGSTLRKFSTKNFRPIFFSPNHSKWFNSWKKNLFPEIRKFFALMTWPWSTLKNIDFTSGFLLSYFLILPSFHLHICQLYEKHSSNHLFPLSLVCSYWT